MAFKLVFALSALSLVLFCQGKHIHNLRGGNSNLHSRDDPYNSDESMENVKHQQPMLQSKNQQQKLILGRNGQEMNIRRNQESDSMENSDMIPSNQRLVDYMLSTRSLNSQYSYNKHHNERIRQQQNEQVNSQYRHNLNSNQDRQTRISPVQDIDDLDQIRGARKNHQRLVSANQQQLQKDVHMKVIDSSETWELSPEQIRMQKIHHDTVAQQNGNGRQKLNRIGERMPSGQYDSSEENDSMNKLMKNRN